MSVPLQWLGIVILLFTGVLGDPIPKPTQPLPVVEATTIITSFNTTFTWNIENLHGYDFGGYQSAKSLTGPYLTAVDLLRNNTVYNVALSLIPEFQYTRYETAKDPIKYTISCKFNPLPETITYGYVINGTEYSGQEISHSQLTGGKVKIRVNAVYSQILKATVFRSSPRVYVDAPLSLADDLLALFKTDPTYQCILETNNEQLIAYKPIMQARSSIFNKLLDQDNTTIKVKENFSPKIYEKMIEFCNYDVIEDFEGEEINLYVVGKTYNIPSLVLYMGREMVKSANTTNILPRFNAVYPYSDTPLLKSFYEYITENFVEVSKQPEFSKLHPDIYQELLKMLLKLKKIV